LNRAGSRFQSTPPKDMQHVQSGTEPNLAQLPARSVRLRAHSMNTRLTDMRNVSAPLGATS
jgi:hypothetical protein